jgi:hypothetical protein
VDADTLVRTVIDRTPDRDQDRTVSADVAGRLFDRLAGPDGLTATASTFARPEVLVALGSGLAGAGRTEFEALADRFLAERAVSGRRPSPGGTPLVHPRPPVRRAAAGHQRHRPEG